MLRRPTILWLLYYAAIYLCAEVRSQGLQLTIPVVEHAQAYRIQIAKDEGFTEIVWDREYKSSRINWEEAVPGDYFLRVAVVDSYNRVSPFSSSSRLKITYPAPQVIAPNDRFEAKTFEDTFKIQLRWKRIERRRDYHLEIAANSEFKDPIVDAWSEDEKYSLPAKVGNFFWRVRARFDNGTLSKVSPIHRFSIQYYPKLVAPVLLFPLPQQAIKTHDSDIINLQWTPVGDAMAYDIEVSKVSRPNSPVWTLYDATTDRVPSSLEEGEYLWHVRSRGNSHRPSDWSEMRSFSVRALREPVERPLYLTISYAPVINSYRLSSNKPSAFFSGPNLTSFHLGINSPITQNTEIHGGLLFFNRTLFESASESGGQVSTAQSSINISRLDFSLLGKRSIALKSDASIHLTTGIGYKGKSILYFTKETNQTLEAGQFLSHNLAAQLGLAWAFFPQWLVSGHLEGAFPLVHSSAINVSNFSHFSTEVSVLYRLSPIWFLSAGFGWDWLHFRYIDTQAQTAVNGTVSDNTQFFRLGLGLRQGF